MFTRGEKKIEIEKQKNRKTTQVGRNGMKWNEIFQFYILAKLVEIEIITNF